MLRLMLRLMLMLRLRLRLRLRAEAQAQGSGLGAGQEHLPSPQHGCPMNPAFTQHRTLAWSKQPWRRQAWRTEAGAARGTVGPEADAVHLGRVW